MKRGRKPYRWTPDLDQYLLDHHKKLTHKQLSEILGFSPGAICQRLIKLARSKQLLKQSRYTQAEIEFIQQHYFSLPLQQIGQHLNRSCMSIYHKARELGLRRESQHRMAIQQDIERLTDNMIAYFMAKGKPELQQALLKHPELLELKRQQYALKRIINA